MDRSGNKDHTGWRYNLVDWEGEWSPGLFPIRSPAQDFLQNNDQWQTELMEKQIFDNRGHGYYFDVEGKLSFLRLVIDRSRGVEK